MYQIHGGIVRELQVLQQKNTQGLAYYSTRPHGKGREQQNKPRAATPELWIDTWTIKSCSTPTQRAKAPPQGRPNQNRNTTQPRLVPLLNASRTLCESRRTCLQQIQYCGQGASKCSSLKFRAPVRHPPSQKKKISISNSISVSPSQKKKSPPSSPSPSPPPPSVV